MSNNSSKEIKGAPLDLFKVLIVFILLILASEGAFLIRQQYTKGGQVISSVVTSSPITISQQDIEFKYFAWGYKGWLESMGFKGGLLPNIYTTITLSGEVTKVVRLEPSSNSDYIGYQVAIKSPENQPIVFSLSEFQEVPNARVIRLKNGEKVITDLGELKEGDFVSVYIDVSFVGSEPKTLYTFNVLQVDNNQIP